MLFIAETLCSIASTKPLLGTHQSLESKPCNQTLLLSPNPSWPGSPKRGGFAKGLANAADNSGLRQKLTNKTKYLCWLLVVLIPPTNWQLAPPRVWNIIQMNDTWFKRLFDHPSNIFQSEVFIVKKGPGSVTKNPFYADTGGSRDLRTGKWLLSRWVCFVERKEIHKVHTSTRMNNFWFQLFLLLIVDKFSLSRVDGQNPTPVNMQSNPICLQLFYTIPTAIHN